MSLPIVGGRFRPPANAIVASLPMGHPLWLEPEPQNEFDPNAIKVVVQTDTIPEESLNALSETLPGFGMDLSEVLAQPSWHLGYIPARLAINMSLAEPLEGKLTFDARGRPEVETPRELEGPGGETV